MGSVDQVYGKFLAKTLKMAMLLAMLTF